MSILNSTAALWYESRATGIMCLLLLTAAAILGIVVNRHGRLPGLPQFAVTGLHRNLSLLATTFLVAHVLTAAADSYVNVPLIGAIVPFTSAYEPLWMGVGAVASDLILAVIITSLVRLRLGLRAWRAVHWSSYAAFLVAVVHSIGSSKDLQSGWLLALTIVCVLAVCAAIGYRLTKVASPAGARRLPPPPLAAQHSRTAGAPGPRSYPHPRNVHQAGGFAPQRRTGGLGDGARR